MKNLFYFLPAILVIMFVVMGITSALSGDNSQGKISKKSMSKPIIDMARTADYETASFGLG